MELYEVHDETIGDILEEQSLLDVAVEFDDLAEVVPRFYDEPLKPAVAEQLVRLANDWLQTHAIQTETGISKFVKVCNNPDDDFLTWTVELYSSTDKAYLNPIWNGVCEDANTCPCPFGEGKCKTLSKGDDLDDS